MSGRRESTGRHRSLYFKSLLSLTTLEQVVEEIYSYAPRPLHRAVGVRLVTVRLSGCYATGRNTSGGTQLVCCRRLVGIPLGLRNLLVQTLRHM